VAACFLFGKPIDIELSHYNAVTNSDETPANLVLISPKFEGAVRRLQSAEYQRALSSKGVDDQQAQASTVRPPIPAQFADLFPSLMDCCRRVVWAAHDRSALGSNLELKSELLNVPTE